MGTVTRSENSIRFESFELNLQTRELYRNGSRLKLRGHPIDVLAVLLEHPGELVTREILRKRLWPDDTFVDSEQILNNSVGKLRDALGDRAETPKYIETLPRLGYRFVAFVEQSGVDTREVQAPPTSESTSVSPSPLHSAKPHRTQKHWFLWPLVASMLLALTILGYWRAHLSLPAPRVTEYRILTLNGAHKDPIGTDGSRLYIKMASDLGALAEVPIGGGQVTRIPIVEPSPPIGAGPLIGGGVSPDGSRLLLYQQFDSREGATWWIVGTSGHPAHFLTKAFSAQWFPDGDSVIYSSVHGEIYSIPADGGESRLLVPSSAPAGEIVRTFDLRLSPDGKTIRFTRDRIIWEVPFSGGAPRQFMPGWNPEELKCCGRWTPDGEFYLFLSHPSLYKGQLFPVQGQLWALDERRGRLRPPVPDPIQLTPGPMLWGPAITSPDGKRIFSRGLSLRGELVRYDRSSGRLEPFLNGISAEFVDFSKDGKHIAYTTFPDGILWRANLDGSGPLQLTKPPVYARSTRWSPDGKKILFTDNSKDGVDTIYVVSSEGGAPERLIPEDSGPQGDATWSPDGRKVVYSTAPWFSFLTWSKSRVETRIFDLNSRTITVLPSYSGGVWSPRWSPDGRYIAAMSFNVSQLLIFDLEKQQWRVFEGKHPHSFGWLCWSKDSRHIYYGRAYYGGSESESEVSRHPGNELWISRYSLERRTEERIANVTGLQVTGWYGLWRGIDPEEEPLMLRDVGTDEIYALTLERR